MSTLDADHTSPPGLVPATSTRKLIRTARQVSKKRYSAEDKIRIVMDGIRDVSW